MRFEFVAKDKISKLPKTSGVYAFFASPKHRGEGGFLYVGKAINIKDRVKNHFLSHRSFSEDGSAFRDNLFINQAAKIGYIKTDSEIEALLLEANLIKKYQPKYNVMWRDDKNYFYAAITKEKFPKAFITHQPKKVSSSLYIVSGIRNEKIPNTKYVGPFVDGTALKQTLKILRKVFPYRSCNVVPKHPCLWYHLNRCPAPCLLKSDLGKQLPNAEIEIKKELQKNAKNIVKILQGKKTRVLKDLKKDMKTASASGKFEKAAKFRDQIRAFEKIMSHSKILTPEAPPKKNDWIKAQKDLKRILKAGKQISRIEAYDVSNIQGKEATGSMVTFVDGMADKNFYRKFKIKISGKSNDTAMIKEILSRRLSHQEWPYPDLILIDGGKPQLNAGRLSINNYQLTIPIVALAKKNNELFIENQKNPILLKSLPREIFNLILQLRDEAHRFAVSYHKKLRARSLFS